MWQAGQWSESQSNFDELNNEKIMQFVKSGRAMPAISFCY